MNENSRLSISGPAVSLEISAPPQITLPFIKYLLIR